MCRQATKISAPTFGSLAMSHKQSMSSRGKEGPGESSTQRTWPPATSLVSSVGSQQEALGWQARSLQEQFIAQK